MLFVHNNLAFWFLWDLYILHIFLYLYYFILYISSICKYGAEALLPFHIFSSLSLSLSACLRVCFPLLPSLLSAFPLAIAAKNTDHGVKKKDTGNNQRTNQIHNSSRLNDNLPSEYFISKQIKIWKQIQKAQSQAGDSISAVIWIIAKRSPL